MDDEEFQELMGQEEQRTTEEDSLRIFGMDLFDRVSVSFEPSFNVPTPKDYTLGAGDQLVIDIWGLPSRPTGSPSAQRGISAFRTWAPST
jgi:protein involved in polysaccharide export with SLBB domain